MIQPEGGNKMEYLTPDKRQDWKEFKGIWEKENFSEVTERIRIKWYRALKVYKTDIETRLEGLSGTALKAWMKGYTAGAKLSQETSEFLFFFVTGEYKVKV